jgi:hypothetical protein
MIIDMQIIRSIQNRIYEIRGERVILDFDLAALYEVATKVLKQAVKRNLRRFPDDFMFRLTQMEYSDLRLQIEALEIGNPLRSQIVTSKGRGGTTYMPYAFTEQGVAMLSGLLNSDVAIEMNIAIMRAFIEIKRLSFLPTDLKAQLKEIKERLEVHDAGLNRIYEIVENLLDEKAAQKKWDNRERIGFRK